MPVSPVQKLRLSACWRMDASVGKKLPSLALVAALRLSCLPPRHAVAMCGSHVGNLCAGLVAGFLERPVPDRLGIAQGKRQVGVSDLTKKLSGQHAAERRSRRDAATVVAAGRDNILGQPMELRQPVRG